MYSMKAQMTNISMMLSTLQINAQTMESFKGVNEVMARVNEEMSV